MPLGLQLQAESIGALNTIFSMQVLQLELVQRTKD